MNYTKTYNVPEHRSPDGSYRLLTLEAACPLSTNLGSQRAKFQLTIPFRNDRIWR